jgi:hypothetical protein
MKRIATSLALAVFVCAAMTALAADETEFTFQTIIYPGDTFTQLLGINSISDKIAGYHGATVNKGFVLTLPSTFTNENFPGSAQTQVIGINNLNQTAGFYIDGIGTTHGFLDKSGTFTTVDFQGTPFNQLLGLNDNNQASGYFGNATGGNDRGYIYAEIGKGAFLQLKVNGGVTAQQMTGINNLQQVCGFYIDTAGKNHGFLLNGGTFQTLDFPGATFTQALGLNNNGLVVGTYMDTGGKSHGFVYNPQSYDEVWDSIDDPSGVGTTVINGINDRGRVVGFFVDTSGHTDGFVGTPIS